MPYTIIDHTADLGITVHAPDLQTLFTEAALAMIEIMGAKALRSDSEIPLVIEAYDREDLLIRWLGELLYQIVVRHLRIADIAIKGLSDTRLEVLFRGVYTPTQLTGNIKAVTYHAVAIRPVDNHLETTIIFDT
jgi:SHS2 domain-containing protein